MWRSTEDAAHLHNDGDAEAGRRGRESGNARQQLKEQRQQSRCEDVELAADTDRQEPTRCQHRVKLIDFVP